MTDFSAWSHHASYIQPGSTDGDKEDYPVSITITYQDFMNSDFGDIRFALADGTELSYSLEDYTEGSSADFLVQVPSLPASPATTTIVIYAGNSAVTTTSDPSLVYLAWDDASSDKSDGYTLVDVYNSGVNASLAYDSTNKCYEITVTATDFVFAEIAALTGQNTLHFEADLQFATYVSQGFGGLIFQELASKTFLMTRFNKSTSISRFDISRYISSNYYVDTSQNYTLSQDVWYTVKADIIGTSITVKWYDTSGNLLYTLTDTVSSTYTNGAFGILAGYNSGNVIAFKNVKALQTTTNTPTTGTLGNWTENSLIISTPSLQSILTVNTPRIAIGGAISITTPPIGITTSINTPTPRAILTSPPITTISTVIPPIIAFLMEVKAGVTYNPDAKDELELDGIPVNISFNVEIGGTKYE